MKKIILIPVLLGLGLPMLTLADSATVTGLFQTYAGQGAGRPDAQQGRDMWSRKFPAQGEYASRSCASCHTENLTLSGKHIRTGKAIKPMSPAVNPERLSSAKNIEKWFRRNCKWTLGRECSPQEKANFLAFISNQQKF